MKLKIFILLMIIVFCTSCAVETKNNTYKNKTTEVEETEEIEKKYTLYILNGIDTIIYKNVTIIFGEFRTVEGKEISLGNEIKYFYVEE
jgi:hypothetical protein